MENNQIVPTQSTQLVAPPEGAWGTEGTHTDDLLIPSIRLQHDLSQAVRNSKAKPGDFLHSTTGEVLPKPIEIIPIKTFRQWLLVEANDVKKMVARIIVDKDNENWSEHGQFNGKPVKRVMMLNFFVLLPGQLDGLPCLVPFKKSGMYAGKILSTHFQTSAMSNKAPARRTFLLGSEQRLTNGNQYMVPTISPGRDTTPLELATAYAWYTRLSANEAAVKVDDGQEATPF